MTFAQKLAISKIALALSAVFIIATIATKSMALTHAYCHGGSAEARTFYCETVYRNEPGYRALPSNW